LNQTSESRTTISAVFQDNVLLQVLCGPQDRNLTRLEEKLGVQIKPHGEVLEISGTSENAYSALHALQDLYEQLKKRESLNPEDIDVHLAFKTLDDDQKPGLGKKYTEDDLVIRTRKKHIRPRSPVQAAYIRALQEFDLTFGLGPAGTGKTYLAVAVAVSMLLAGRVERIIVSRPVREAGESLGFLPGDIKEKIDPYLRPIYDALNDILLPDQVEKYMISGEIEIAPLAFMRGRTLSNAFVILDEAQNTTPVQMKMLLTRLGERSKMAITGDLSQIDLPSGLKSGLRDALDILRNMEGVTFIYFTEKDVVRHPIVARIIKAYTEFYGI
jgi:phosphate starvation-inducible PhoH-like protein